MAQTNIAIYLSIINWIIIIFSIYYYIMKKYILTTIRSKLFLKSSNLSSIKLICFRSKSNPYFPIFL